MVRQNANVTMISCPVCAGPVELVGEKPGCLIGHDFDADELGSQLGEEAARALWSAVRALEDAASGARWRASQPAPPFYLEAQIEQVEREARLLRDLLDSREGHSATDRRPERW